MSGYFGKCRVVDFVLRGSSLARAKDVHTKSIAYCSLSGDCVGGLPDDIQSSRGCRQVCNSCLTAAFICSLELRDASFIRQETRES